MNKTIFLFSLAMLYSRIILKKLTHDRLIMFRNVEKNLKKFMKNKADISYLEFCSSNRLLPKFTNFRLYDVSADSEPSTTSFRMGLIEREIKKKRENEVELRRTCSKDIFQLNKSMSPFRFYACLMLLSRTTAQCESDQLMIHQRKLTQLYGGKIYFPENNSKVINISSYEPKEAELNLLNMGLNYSLKKSYDPVLDKVEMEKLTYNILAKERDGKVVISGKEDMKTKLKHFSIRNKIDSTKKNLSPCEYDALKTLKNNKNIVLQRPDKGDGVVIMDSGI